MATSGPGATNLVSPIADAYMDSIPLVAITGQVKKEFIGKMAFQETDFFGMTLPVVKHSYLVMDVHELPRIMKEAFHLARSGRPGPVVIDIPKDVQQAKFQPVFPASVEFRNPILSATHLRERRGPPQGAGPGGRREEAGHLRRRGHHLGRGPPRAQGLCRGDPHPGRDDPHGPRLLPGDEPALDAVVRHARGRLRQLGGRRVRPLDRPRRPLRRPDHRRHAQVRGAGDDRPHRRRRVRAQQEQAGGSFPS
jgi:hypothetical protein